MSQEILSPAQLSEFVRLHDRQIVNIHYTVVLLSKALGIKEKQMAEILKTARLETERAALIHSKRIEDQKEENNQ